MNMGIDIIGRWPGGLLRCCAECRISDWRMAADYGHRPCILSGPTNRVPNFLIKHNHYPLVRFDPPPSCQLGKATAHLLHRAKKDQERGKWSGHSGCVTKTEELGCQSLLWQRTHLRDFKFFNHGWSPWRNEITKRFGDWWPPIGQIMTVYGLVTDIAVNGGSCLGNYI